MVQNKQEEELQQFISDSFDNLIISCFGLCIALKTLKEELKMIQEDNEYANR